MKINHHPIHVRSRAFTLVEVLVALVVLGLGLLSVLALVLSGTRDAKAAMALASAFSTARTVITDPALVDADGFINGYYVVRTVEDSSTAGGVTTDLVQVRVYWGANGDQIAGVTSYVRQ